ncbi:MAG: hypothetical protein K0R08_1660 [Solimicrobium sp.]|jgi:hypothetical protein|nr:hypothetical protein [Solimicrobium sp.]
MSAVDFEALHAIRDSALSLIVTFISLSTSCSGLNNCESSNPLYLHFDKRNNKLSDVTKKRRITLAIYHLRKVDKIVQRHVPSLYCIQQRCLRNVLSNF